MDEGFPRRLGLTTAWVASVLALMAADPFGWHLSAGILAGAGLGIAGVLSLEAALNRLRQREPALRGSGPGGDRRRMAAAGAARRLALIGLLRLPLAGGVLAVLAVSTRNDPQAMLGAVAGATLVPLVILLKFAGRALAAALGADPTPRGRRADA